MKPQSDAFLEKANEMLRQAGVMLAVDLSEAAGRAAYLSGFHAAQGLIFERTGKVVKTHRGVHAEFSRLAKESPAIDMATRAFLGRAYDLKSIADYETGPGAVVSADQAAETIASAKLFIEQIEALLR